MEEDVLYFSLNHSSSVLPQGGHNLQNVDLSLLLQLSHPHIGSDEHPGPSYTGTVCAVLGEREREVTLMDTTTICNYGEVSEFSCSLFFHWYTHVLCLLSPGSKDRKEMMWITHTHNKPEREAVYITRQCSPTTEFLEICQPLHNGM